MDSSVTKCTVFLCCFFDNDKIHINLWLLASNSLMSKDRIMKIYTGCIKKVDKSEIALYFEKRLNVGSFVLK